MPADDGIITFHQLPSVNHPRNIGPVAVIHFTPADITGVSSAIQTDLALKVSILALYLAVLSGEAPVLYIICVI